MNLELTPEKGLNDEQEVQNEAQTLKIEEAEASTEKTAVEVLLEKEQKIAVENEEQVAVKVAEEIASEEHKQAPKAAEPEFIEIYTDGACSGNPGPGGWAAVMMWGEHKKEISGGEKLTTNNKMELLAAIQALRTLTREDIKVKLYTDSLYLKKGMTEWIEGWKKKAFKDVKNVELWKELDGISSKFAIEWHWVKAHAGHMHNEMADRLARDEALRSR